VQQAPMLVNGRRRNSRAGLVAEEFHRVEGTGRPPALVADEVGHLADGDDHQQPPQAFAVEQLREPPSLGSPAEAGKGAEGYVLLVLQAPRRALELLARQPDQAAEVALPQPLDGGRVADHQPVDQPRHRATRRHGYLPWEILYGKTSRDCNGPTRPIASQFSAGAGSAGRRSLAG